MSFLSDQQQPGSPFSDYGEACKEPSLSPTVPAQTWDWPRSPSVAISTPRSLRVGGGPLATTALTDEDKLCFFEQPGRADAELKAPGKVGVLPGSPSLGSAAESPVSPLSSSLSPSLASPGRLASALACGSRASLERPLSTPASVIDASLANADSPSEAWNRSPPGECGPMVAVPQVSLHCSATGATREYRGQKPVEELPGSGFPKVKSDSEEEEWDSEPFLWVHAEQERKGAHHAVSECSHLALPTAPEPPDGYPREKDIAANHAFSPFSQPGCSPDSPERLLTVAEDLPPTPPPCLSSGTAKVELWQAPPEPGLLLPSFSSLIDNTDGAPPPSAQREPAEAVKAEKELGGVVHQEPSDRNGACDFAISSPASASTDTEEESNLSSQFAAFRHADLEHHTGVFGLALEPEGAPEPGVGGHSDDETTASSFHRNSCGKSGNAADGRWSLLFSFEC